MPTLLTIAGVVVTLALAVALVMVVMSSSRKGVIRGSLRARKIEAGKLHTAEEYVQDKLTMTVKVDLKPDHDTVTINAEGPPADVERVTGVLRDVLAPSVIDVRQPPREARRLRSEFTVVRRTVPNARPSVVAQVDYAIPEEHGFRVHQHHRPSAAPDPGGP